MAELHAVVMRWGRVGVLALMLVLCAPASAGAASLFGAGFASPAVAGYPGRLVTARFDASGNPDVALITGYPTQQVDVMLGDGHGGFTLSSGSPLLSGGYYGIATGDFNSDGNEDIAVTDFSAGTVTVVLGNGDGTFKAPGSPISVGSGSSDIVAGFFKSGSPEDLAVRINGGVKVLAGNGDGTFTVGSLIGPSNASALGVGYFGTNGAPDLAVAGSDGNVTMLMDGGSANFTALPPVSSGVSASTATPESIAAGYFQNASTSTLQDLAVGFSDGEASVLLNQSAHPGTLAPATGSPVHVSADGTQLLSIAAADVDGNGTTDLVGGGYWQGGPGVVYNSVGVMLGDDHGGLTRAPGSPYLVGGVAAGVATGAFYGATGKLDIAAADGGSCNGNVVEVLRNQGATGSGPPTGVFAGDGCRVPASASGLQLSGNVDSRFNGTVAHIADNEYAAGYSAQIDWGDGQSSPGSVTQTYPPGFDVSGSHTYTTQGAHRISVRMTKTAGAGTGITLTAVSTIDVGPLVAAPPGSTVTVTSLAAHHSCPPYNAPGCAFFQAHVADANGIPLANLAVHFSSSPDPPLVSADAHTDSAGNAQIAVVPSDQETLSGFNPSVTESVTASVPTTAGGTLTSAPATVQFVPVTIASVIAGPLTFKGVIGGTATLTVLATDTYGNALTFAVSPNVEPFSPVRFDIFAGDDAGEALAAEPLDNFLLFPRPGQLPGDSVTVLNQSDKTGQGTLDEVEVHVEDHVAPMRNGSFFPILLDWSPKNQPPPINAQSKAGLGLSAAGAGAGFIAACAAGVAGGAETFGVSAVVALAFGCGGALASTVGAVQAYADPPSGDPRRLMFAQPLTPPAVSGIRCRNVPNCSDLRLAVHGFQLAQGRLQAIEETLGVAANRHGAAIKAGEAVYAQEQSALIHLEIAKLPGAIDARARAGRRLVGAIRRAHLPLRLPLRRNAMALERALRHGRGVPTRMIRRFLAEGLARSRAALFRVLLAEVARQARTIDLRQLLTGSPPTAAFRAVGLRFTFADLDALLAALTTQAGTRPTVVSKLEAALKPARATCDRAKRSRALSVFAHTLRAQIRGPAAGALSDAAVLVQRSRCPG